MQRTFVAKNEEIGKSWNRDWYLVNAEGKRLGRLASEIAMILQGKRKPIYTPHNQRRSHPSLSPDPGGA